MVHFFRACEEHSKLKKLKFIVYIIRIRVLSAFLDSADTKLQGELIGRA